MAPKDRFPAFYRLWFTWADPLISLGTTYMSFFEPDFGVNAVIPSSISVRNPLHDFLLHQLGALFLMIAVNTGILLRYSSDVGVWKIVQAGILAVDLILLWSQYYSLDQQGRLEYSALRAEDIGSVLITVFVAVLRALFLLNVGFGAEKARNKSA